MRIVFIAHKLDNTAGGSNFSLDLMARSLCERDHDVQIVTLNVTSSNDLPNNRPYEVTQRSVKKKDLLTPSRVAAVFEEYESEADIYHVFSPLLSPYAGYYRRNGGNIPVFCRMNQYRSLCSNVSKMDGECHNQCGMGDLFRHSTESIPNRLLRMPFYYLQSKKYTDWMNSADIHYAISPAVKDVFKGFGVDGETIEVIPNFYDPEFTTDDTSTDGTCTEILYVGRLSPEKGVDLLIQALKDVPSDISLRIVGDGLHQAELELQASNMGLDERVTFCGRIDHENLPEYYRSADVFVHPGRWPEPFGRTILEAWQTNCVVVSSNIGGPPWVIDDAGLLFERNDAAGLAKQINRCATNEECMTDLQKRGDDRLEAFSPETVLDAIESKMHELATDQTA